MKANNHSILLAAILLIGCEEAAPSDSTAAPVPLVADLRPAEDGLIAYIEPGQPITTALRTLFGWSLSLVRPDGKGRKQIIEKHASGYDPFRILWTPGNERLVSSLGLYSRDHRVVVTPVVDPHVTAIGDGDTGAFAISPKGDQVAYVCYNDVSRAKGLHLCVSRLDGAGETIRIDQFQHVDAPCWSSDGSRVVFVADGSLQEFRVANGQCWKLASAYSFPQFLPDGQSMLVLEYSVMGPTSRDMFVLDPATGTTRLLQRKVAPMKPVLSPDGSRAAYLDASGHIGLPLGASNMILIVRLDDGEVTSIARGNCPTWSPDGARLAYERDGFIHLMNLDTKEESVLVRGAYPSWSR